MAFASMCKKRLVYHRSQRIVTIKTLTFLKEEQTSNEDMYFLVQHLEWVLIAVSFSNSNRPTALRTQETLHKKLSFNKDFFDKCDQFPSSLWIWSHLLKKSIMENLIFCAVKLSKRLTIQSNITVCIKGTLMQIRKSPSMFVFM